ncbi:SMP-30/gluconolactonase/LRE family protein [Mucilaginibacter myungsuensis]|uniref:Regucalcin n=1 Tax=Mucilaginibacter myungsuensis TaxID=649104 RepID=A0A929KZQ2_9SPHI|nr:SMP-30/gluconolactonase/LRE family protein [Mucilaginibacter myungsuensis]MBE9660631.1 SMP-30/gluconolactonase/LRE family protein [Mucilaginibacter myungsuensis]MDN3600676.1 SMP-30/gluconolactonase/LRE family protein [Mucilaginibacter myungsuensis]
MLVEVVVPHICTLGEGPVWDKERKVILWIDIHKGDIYEYSTPDKRLRTISVGEMIGTIAVCADGRLIAALANGFAFIDRATGDIERIADPESDLPGNRFNDGKCDPAGRFWAGTMALDEKEGAGNLYMLGKDLRLQLKLSDVTISNGIAWSADDKVMYYIDTPTKQVVAFDFDVADGTISNERVVVKLPDGDGYPDGMTIDAEDKLWIAHWDGWQVSRWDPLTGEKLLSVSMPAANITSCTFGGDDLQDLYITSASVGLSKEQLQRQPLAGSLLVIRNCGYQGRAAELFGQYSQTLS